MDRVLLIIRNPLALVVSSYYQDVKEGASHSFEAFMSTRRPDMLANLDLASMVRTFSKIDAKITVLPVEMLAGTEGIFWAEYERRLRLPKPNVDLLLSDPLAANSTRRETIPLHRQINAILSELEGVVALHEWPEGETLREALSCSRVWSVRRALSVVVKINSLVWHLCLEFRSGRPVRRLNLIVISSMCCGRTSYRLWNVQYCFHTKMF